MDFDIRLGQLVAGVDADKWPTEVARLRACRSLRDLERLSENGGWLSTTPTDPRLKLVRHGSGTYLVVAYQDGWSTRVTQQDFPRR